MNPKKKLKHAWNYMMLLSYLQLKGVAKQHGKDWYLCNIKCVIPILLQLKIISQCCLISIQTLTLTQYGEHGGPLAMSAFGHNFLDLLQLQRVLDHLSSNLIATSICLGLIWL